MPAAAEDPELAAFDTPRLIAELARRGYRTAQARQNCTQRPASGRRPSKAAELDAAAARGVMPTGPDVTSHANHHYQKRFDTHRAGGTSNSAPAEVSRSRSRNSGIRNAKISGEYQLLR